MEKSCFLRSLNKLNLTPGLEVREVGGECEGMERDAKEVRRDGYDMKK